MPYGTIKVDTITFTSGSSDVSVAISGLVQNPTFSGNVTVTGTVSGTIVRGNTVSGATVTGTAGQFGTLTGNTAGFTTVTGTTVTGVTVNFVSGVFTTQVSGATITGNTGLFSTFTGVSGVFTTVISGASGVIGGNITASAFIPTGSGVPSNGIYAPSGNIVGIAANSSGILWATSTGIAIGAFPSIPYNRLSVYGTDVTESGLAATIGPAFVTSTVNNADTTAVKTCFTVARIGKQGISYGNQVNFNIGRYSQTGSAAQTQLTLRLANGNVNDPDVDVLTLLANGKVGINTTTPGAFLEVSTADTTSTDLAVTNTSTGQAVIRITAGVVGVANRAARINFYNGVASTSVPRWTLLNDYNQDGTNDFSFVNAGNSRFPIITQAPNLLVGAVSWGGGASVVGGIEAISSSYVAGGQVTQRLSSFRSAASDNNGSCQVGIDFFRVPRGGGIQSGSEMAFYTGYTYLGGTYERMRLTQDGHLLVNSTDPNNYSSGFYLSATETGQTPVRKFMLSEFGQSGTAYTGQWRWLTSSAWGSVFKQGFRLHLRNYDAGSAAESGDLFRFDGNGAAYNATGTWGTITSNLNLKQDITAASSQWGDIKQIKFHKYRYIADVQQSLEAEEKTGVATEAPFQMGVIAEELEEICPNLVENSVDPEGNKTSAVKYSILYMKAVKALQEAMERIEVLEGKVTALETT